MFINIMYSLKLITVCYDSTHTYNTHGDYCAQRQRRRHEEQL